MKHVLLFLVFINILPALKGQTDYGGRWKGAIEIPGMQLELAVSLRQENDAWVGDLDIPVQGVKGMKLAELSIAAGKISFRLPEVPGNASFAGNFDSSAENITGTFSQAGQQFPMKLARESALQQQAEAKRIQDAVGQLRHLSDSLRQLLQVPGLAFGIVKDGKVWLAEGYGFRNEEKKLPVTTNTQFAIGSSTKAFTAAGLAILADRELLEWDKPVVEYLADFKLYDELATKAVTPVDLLCHRTGLPRHDLMWYGSDLTRTQIYERLRYLPPNKSLRTTWQYNNLMFMTAGILTERLSGTSWEDFVQTNIFDPLGMKNSSFSVNDLAKNNDAAIGYYTKNKKNTEMEYRNIDAVGPAGCINSSVSDMLLWVQMHLDDGKAKGKQIVSSSGIEWMHQPHMLMEKHGSNKEIYDPSYGLGWFVYRHRGLQVVEHGGNIDGFTALVYMVPEKDFGLVVLANQNASSINTILARYATDLVLGLEQTDWYARVAGGSSSDEEEDKSDKPRPKRVDGTSPSHDLDAYTGVYEHPGYGKVYIERENDLLTLRYNTFSALLMEHWHYDVFYAEDSTLEISLQANFQTDMNGNIISMSTGIEPMVDAMVFTKRPPEQLSNPAFLSRLAGGYLLEKQEMNIEFELRGKTLFAKISGQPEYALVPFQGTEFKLKDLSGYSVEFLLNDEGKVTGARFIQPEGVYQVKRQN